MTIDLFQMVFHWLYTASVVAAGVLVGNLLAHYFTRKRDYTNR